MLRVLVVLTLVRLSTSTFNPELDAKYRQMPRDQFIQYFNKQNYTWKIKHHPHLDNTDHTCVILNDTRRTNVQFRRHYPRPYVQLPENFDAREKWANCDTIKEIYNQGNCGSCWAFATATVASDRTCIDKGLNVRLSEQDFDCLQPLCIGGTPEDSFPFWRDQGLVTLDCKPYNILDKKGCVKECKDPSINYDNDKHFADNIYTISSDDNDIRTELFTNGPIFAAFTVYEDFFNYKSGIYEHQYGDDKGGHAVRLIGYGVENGIEYWLAANSWGPTWGENGFFKIKRYQDFLISFESWLYTGKPRN